MKFLPNLKPKRFSFKYRGEECLNCQHPLDRSDAYCPSCGQPNSNKKIKLKDLIEELLGSLISYDSKLWQSLKYIFLKPGALAKAYTNGQRRKFTNPFRFFLSVAIIFFLVISQFFDYKTLDEINFMSDDYKTNPGLYLADSIALAKLQDSILNIGDSQADKKQEIQEKIKILQEKIEILKSNSAKSSLIQFDGVKKDDSKSLEKALMENKYLSFDAALELDLVEDTYYDYLKFRFYRGLVKSDQNFSSFISFLIPKVPFYLFIFIPLFSILHILLFFGAGKSYAEHIIFNFSLSSFLLIISAIALLISNAWESGWLNLLMNIGVFYYTYRSIRTFYENSRLASFLKTAFIAFIYPIGLILFLIGITAISFAFY